MAKMNPNGEDAAGIKQDNGEGNHASTSDLQITDQDVDLGLTLPPSDRLFNTSCFAHDAAYSSKFAFPAQEFVIEESPKRELPRFHGIFDDDVYLEESPAKRQRLTPEIDPLPSQEDEVSSTSNIQIRAPSIVSEAGTQQSRTDSGYGTNIAESCASIQGVNDTRLENIQLPDANADLWGDHAHFDSFHAEFNPPLPEENEHFTLNNPKNLIPPNPEPILQQINEIPPAPPKPDVPTTSFNLHLPLKARRVNILTKTPKGFGPKKMSRADVIKMGASAGLFPNSHQVNSITQRATYGESTTPSPRNSQTQNESTTFPAAQNIMDLPLPLAICVALSDSAIRPATLATIYRTQSAIVHGPARSSQPNSHEGSLLKALRNLYEKFQTERSLRDTVIKFVLEKLEERVDDPKTVRPTMKWMALENDLAAMETAIKDCSDTQLEKQQLGLETGSEILKRNAEHIKELLAGMPHMKNLEARITSQSKQIEALAAKCQELELQAQYRSAIAQAAKHTEALVPAPVRMPPPLPSAFTPFEALPEDFVPQPQRIYRISAPPVNTAWMCAYIDAKSGGHCGAIMKSWIPHRRKGHELWISHTTCVKCKQVHKSLAFKYFLHESEVHQLGGISKARRGQDDSLKPQNDTPKHKQAEDSREPAQVATPSPELQPMASVSDTTRPPTQTSSTIKFQQLNVPQPVRHLQIVSSPAKRAELHPAVMDPRRAPGRLHIPDSTFARNAGAAFSAHPPELQQYNTAPYQPQGRAYYLQPQQHGSYGYDQRHIPRPPPQGSPYPQHTQQYHWTRQEYYGQTIQQSEYGPAPDRRLSNPSSIPPRQQQTAPPAQRTNLGMPQTLGLALASLLPAAPTPKPAVPIAIPVPTPAKQLKRPLPTEADIIVLDPENNPSPSPSLSQSDDSQPPAAKKRCKGRPPKTPNHTVKNPSRPRTLSLAPIAKQTVDTLRSSMKLPEKAWMRSADLPETVIVSDGEGERGSPSSSQLIGMQAPEPPTQAAPPKKTRQRTRAAPKVAAPRKTTAKKPRARAKAVPKVVVSVEDVPTDALAVAPALTASGEAQTPVENHQQSLGHSQDVPEGDADAGSLFGDSREMSDEMADEWAKKLEAEMSMTPDTNAESEEWGRELEAEMEMTPDVEEESEEE